MRTVTGARRLLRRAKVMTLTATPGVPSLVEAVAGGPIRGSWWGHPLGGVVFRIAEALSDGDDALVLKLVAGKVTFVHRDAWPPLARVVLDAAWRRSRTRALGPRARSALRSLERRGAFRLQGADDPGKAARMEIEQSLLAVVSQEHTESGNHATVLRSWKEVLPADVRREASALALAEAYAAWRAIAPGFPLPGR